MLSRLCVLWTLLAVVAIGTARAGSVSGTLLLPTSDAAARPLAVDTVVLLNGPGFSESSHVTQQGLFAFADVPAGDYLLQAASRTHAFPPLRVVVDNDANVNVYMSNPSHPWDAPASRQAYPIRLRAASTVSYYTPPEAFNPLAMLRNPMILMALVSFGMLFLLPKLTASIGKVVLARGFTNNRPGGHAGVPEAAAAARHRGQPDGKSAEF